MIRELAVTEDGGFPVVTWLETRNLHSEPIEVRIKRAPETGVLMFVRTGLVQDSPYEDGRPWETLGGFVALSAQQVFDAAGDTTLRDAIGRRSEAFRILTGNTASVIRAGFNDDRAVVQMNINQANCSLVERERLHDTLNRCFIAMRPEGHLVAPPGSPLPIYAPRAKPPAPPAWVNALTVLVPVALVAAFLWVVCRVVGVLGP
jgi:hypothetical protein